MPSRKSPRYAFASFQLERNSHFRSFPQKLRRNNALKAINDAMDKGINLRTIGIPEIRHFLYKSKSNAQLLCSEITAPYNTPEQFQRLEFLYYDIHHRIHNTNRPLKLIYQMQEKEIILAWVSSSKLIFAHVPQIIQIHILFSHHSRSRRAMNCMPYSSQLSIKIW